MTVTKPYGLIAIGDGVKVGEFITEGPQGSIENPVGWVMTTVSCDSGVGNVDGFVQDLIQ